jgi:hypothetical protein
MAKEICAPKHTRMFHLETQGMANTSKDQSQHVSCYAEQAYGNKRGFA